MNRLHTAPRIGPIFFWATLALCALPAFAQEAGVAARAEAGATLGDVRVARIQELMEGKLDISVEPQTLFDVPLVDATAIEIEARHIRTLLAAVEEASRPPPAPSPGKKRAREPRDAALPDAEIEADGSGWLARIELDRARLAFYSLSTVRRADLLEAHHARQVVAQAHESEEERRAREAEEERQQVLVAARDARSETERVVVKELARLLAVKERVAATRDRFRKARVDLVARHDMLLGWHRRVREARAASPREADAVYDALRRALRASRDELANKLNDIGSDVSQVSRLGSDPLKEIPADISTERARVQRRSVEGEIAQAHKEERGLRQDVAAMLLDEIDALNRERLGLLNSLSSHKRDAITGFSEAGWDQAQSEGRHLQLILRYHLHASLDWIRSIRTGGSSGISTWKALATGTPWLLLVLGFAWVRRRMPDALLAVEQRIIEADRAERRASPSIQRQVVRFLGKVHGPLGRLLFFFAALWLAPDSVTNLLEVQLLSSIIGWVLGVGLVVESINAFAAGTRKSIHDGQHGNGELRLRSLRLIGTTVVVIALVLVVSSRLVGEGTVYRWVLSTCWLAVFPIFLVLIRWWRETVFERIARARKKTPLQAWVLANRTGWKSFSAAMLGAIQLFTLGALKTGRRWVSEFDLARRVHAYLFKRELERMGEGGGRAPLRPLSAGLYEALSPDVPSETRVLGPGAEVLTHIKLRLADGRGGILAIVGGRGMGKSSLLSALAERRAGTLQLDCSAHFSLDQIAEQLEGGGAAAPTLVLLESAHALLKPVIGGLRAFDELISFARSHCSPTTWVLSFDVVMWAFLKRARDQNPIFDAAFVLEPWTEDQIHALLKLRCEQSGIVPSYEDLLEKLPPGSDEIDRLDALKLRESGYVRMLWDHVGGNPGLALESFRHSLGEDEQGAVHVRPLQSVDSSELDVIPDAALFILRAVLQLAPARASDVALVTRLSEEQVTNALRFGSAHGYFEEREGRTRLTWRWLRPVLRLLERRHLLVKP